MDAEWIKSIIEARRQREQIFGSGLFSDPAWDFLLSLYTYKLSGERCTIADISRMTGIAYTTALRWVAELEKAGLLVKSTDKNDRRLVLIELSAVGLEDMKRYFGNSARPGLGL